MAKENFVTKSFKNTSEEIEKIPMTSGLYYLYDSDEILMYIGRAKSIRSRIREHRDLNSWVVKMGFSWEKYEKEFSKEKRNLLPLLFGEVNYDLGSKPIPLVIDIIFDRVKTIEIEDMDFGISKTREIERILEWQPMYNHETASEEYYEIKGHYYDD